MVRVTALGWWTGVFMVTSGFFGLDANRALAYMLFSLTVGLLLVGLVTSLRLRHRLVVERRLPGVAAAGGLVNYRLAVTNEGKRMLVGVRLVDMAPPLAAEVDEFVAVKEPGERTRNGFDRFFRYYRWSWLAERRHVREDSWSEPFDIDPGETKVIEMRFVALRRGRAEFNDLRLTRISAFGVFRAVAPVAADSQGVVVLPKRLSATPQMMGGSSRYQLGGDSASSSIGQSDEFHALRDFMPGDSMHHIHWKSWARVGRPIVRQFENVFFPRYGLVIDSQLPDFPKGSAHRMTAAFENAMAIAATLAADFDARETFLDVLVAGEQALHIESGPHRSDTRHVLEVLAGLQQTPENDEMHGIQALVRQHASAMTGCWVLLMDWGGWRSELVNDLCARGVEVRVLVVKSEGVPFSVDPDPRDAAVRVIESPPLDSALTGWTTDARPRQLAGA